MTTRKVKKYLLVALPGGLGNQIFAFFAGSYFAKVLNRELILDLSSIDKHHTLGKFDIRTFNIKSRMIKYRKSNSFLDFIENRIIGGRTRFALINYILNNLMGNFLFMPGSDDIKATSKVLMPMKYFLRNKKWIKINGFFGDLSYFDEIYIEPDFMQLKNPSNWFIDNLNLIETKHDYVSLHIRLGDFEKNSESVGLLSIEYYSRAIMEARKFSPQMKILVFSDDVLGAQKLLNELHLTNVEYLFTPENSNPAESLVLLSKAKASILSNSTFGLIGARLGSPKKFVIYPKPFRKDSVLEIAGLPSEWKPVESAWR